MYSIENYKDRKYIKIDEKFDGLKICFTTKDSNLGVKTEERRKETKTELEKAYEFLKIKPVKTFIMDQAHTDRIEKIEKISDGEEIIIGRIFYETDGMVTDLKNVALISRFADCVPILIYDENKKVQASVHSGWRGTVKRIGEKAAKKIIEEYGSNLSNLKILLGPAIGFEDFEVKLDVKEIFEKEFKMKDFIKTKDSEHYLIDLIGVNRKMFLDLGIKEENIFTIPLSTYSTKYLKSYRRDKDKSTMGMISVLIK